jgi:hypothetical protein
MIDGCPPSPPLIRMQSREPYALGLVWGSHPYGAVEAFEVQLRVMVPELDNGFVTVACGESVPAPASGQCHFRVTGLTPATPYAVRVRPLWGGWGWEAWEGKYVLVSGVMQTADHVPDPPGESAFTGAGRRIRLRRAVGPTKPASAKSRDWHPVSL